MFFVRARAYFSESSTLAGEIAFSRAWQFNVKLGRLFKSHIASKISIASVSCGIGIEGKQVAEKCRQTKSLEEILSVIGKKWRRRRGEKQIEDYFFCCVI